MSTALVVGAPSSTSEKRLISLDAVRGVAILLVLGQHAPTDLRIHPVLDAVSDYLHKNGYLGVDLFFVLSGFLIGGLLFAEAGLNGKIRVGRFLARRAFKIWPAYLVCLTVTILAAGYAGRDAAGQPGTTSEFFADMAPAYLHIQNYVPSTARFVWFWSLGVEEHFYLLLPGALVLLGARGADGRQLLRRVVWLGIAVVIICLTLRGITWALDPTPNGYIHAFPTHLRADSLMVGVVIAAIARFAPGALAPLRPWRWLLAFVGVGVFLLPAVLPGGKLSCLAPFDFTITAFGSTCFVLLAYFADLPVASNRRSWKWTRYNAWLSQAVACVGFFSYSIYLWHGYFAPAISNRLMIAAHLPTGAAGTSTVIHIVFYLCSAIGLGVGGYWVIERPFLALRERFIPKRAGTCRMAHSC